MKKQTEWIDISVEIGPDTVVWPGSKSLQCDRINEISRGASSNDTSITINLHTGTHIDAPQHFISDGDTVELLDLRVLVGEAYVAEIYGKETISAQDLAVANIPAGVKRLLVKTENSQIWQKNPHEFQQDFIAFGLDAAHWIVERGIKIIGIDYLSIQKYNGDMKVHQTILGNNIIALEGVDLSEITQGYYDMICLPLRIKGVEASPVRALLCRKDGPDEK